MRKRYIYLRIEFKFKFIVLILNTDITIEANKGDFKIKFNEHPSVFDMNHDNNSLSKSHITWVKL